MVKRMKQKIVAATVAAFMTCTSLGGVVYADTVDLTYWIGDGLTRYYDTQAAPVTPNREIKLQAARNEWETGQIVLKSETQGFTINNVRLSDLTNGVQTIESSNLSYNFALYQFDMLTNTAGQWGQHGKPLYPYSGIPDPLSNAKDIEVTKGKNQPIYIKAYIPEGIMPGTYTGMAVVETTLGDIEVPIEVEVFSATVPKIKDAGFTYYNWMSDIVQGYYTEWNVFKTYYEVEDVIRTPEGLDFSTDFYEIVNNWAQSMIEHRQNSVLIHTVAMLDAADTTIDEKGTYTFDWTLFDKYIDLWLSNGMTSIANIHYGYHEKDVMLKDDGNGNAVFTWDRYSMGNGLDKEKDNWYKQYLPALAQHIESYDITKYPQFAGTDKETLFDIWSQQLYDEPTATNLWVYYAQLTREYLVVRNETGEAIKNVKIFDADMTGATRNKPYTDYTDIQVPQLKFIPGNEGIYQNLQDQGQDFWVYVCVSPTKPWLNRFVGQPDTTYPMLFWYEAQVNATGYLHWAFNVWNIGYADDGDCYMVYPDVEKNDILSSIRYEGQRDGIEDWELFQLAKQTDDVKTQEILDRAVSHPNGTYLQDIEDYRALRHAMLHLASGNADIEVPNVGVPGTVVAPQPPLGAYYVDNLDPAIKYTDMEKYAHSSETESYRKSVHFQNYSGPVGSYGGSAELDFTGTGIEIMSEQRGNKGDILVELYQILEDGTTQEIERTVVSCLSQSTKPFYFPYKKTGLEYGDYRIRMTNIRTVNGDSKTQMLLDAFMVHTLQEDGSSAIAKVDLLASDQGVLVASSEGIIIESGDSVKRGKEVTITAVPETGYYCKALNINGMQYPVTNNTYIIEAIDKDIIVAAVFEKIPGETIPATNVALGKNVVASSTDTANGYLTEYVVNGNTDTTSKLAWSNDANVNNYRESNLWIQVELDKVTRIDTVNLYWNGWGTTYVPNTYEIQVSTTGEEESFQTVATQTNHVNGKSEFVFDEVDAKYVRIWMPKNASAGHTAILLHEFEVMSAPQIIPEEVDKTALLALIEEVEGMDTSIYTKPSVEVLNKALQEAKICMQNIYATQGEVADAFATLTRAKESLVIISEAPVFYTVGEEKVYAGEDYQLGIGIDAKDKAIYAQEIYVTYDKGLVEYVGYEMLNDTVEVLIDDETTEGLLHIFTVTPDGGVSSDKLLMNLNFKVKEESKKSTKMQVAGCVGVIKEGDVVGSNAETLEAKEHTIIIENDLQPGDILDVNKDSTIDVADLALIAYYYRKVNSDPNWNAIKHVDINKDGIIDIKDLVEVAMKIKNK
ncbi:glycoside hydrolase domain-containing protein [Niameybacter massiliensis]|uniref:glycoside hydrolase domain-containing protein n=1 Tax=Niameybacter massiliensis TaxID=1658108 RepID=UPI0006B52AB9|nr:glycoside hydrolase domain-containing protein [Niameybacter massiliensis]